VSVLRETLRKAAAGETLTEGEAERALETIMEGTVPPAATAALLTALRVRGESVSEIVGFARAMRRFAARVEAPEQVGRCIKEVGIGFMFARTHHPAMKFVAPVRAELPFRTVFNLLGPLTNPAGAKRQVVGVFGGAYVRPVAEALRGLGAHKALVVHGRDGMDEITVTGKTLVVEVGETGIEEYEISPEDFGLGRHAPDGLLGGDAHLNARILRDIVSGEETGAARDVVLLNAGAAIYVSGKAKTIEGGVRLAEESISSGVAEKALEDFVRTTRRLGSLV
jgi:anthranilate phosphoribosyltransferase